MSIAGDVVFGPRGGAELALKHFVADEHVCDCVVLLHVLFVSCES